MVFTKIAISGLVLASASALPSSGEQDIKTGVENVIEEFRRRLADTQTQRPECDEMDVLKVVLNANSCDDLENVPPEFEECWVDGDMTGKTAMMMNAIYCKSEFNNSIEAYKEAMRQGGSGPGEEDTTCTKEQLKQVQTTLTDVNNCGDMLDMFNSLDDGNAEFYCDEMEEIMEDFEGYHPSDCTDRTVDQFKKRVNKAMAKANPPRNQGPSSEPSDSKEPSAAPRRGRTTTEAIFASLLASVFFAALLL